MCDYHHWNDMKHFYHPKMFPYPLWYLIPPSPQHLATTDLVFVSVDWPFPEYCISGIIRYVALRDRFSHRTQYFWNSSTLLYQWCALFYCRVASFVWLLQFVQSSTNWWDIGWFPVRGNCEENYKRSCTDLCMGMCFHFMDPYLGVGSGSYGESTLNFVRKSSNVALLFGAPAGHGWNFQWSCALIRTWSCQIFKF